jgi:predicted kinase
VLVRMFPIVTVNGIKHGSRRTYRRSTRLWCGHHNGHVVKPVVFVLGGLPGTGKSTVAALLARELKVPYLRIDTIEQALRHSGEFTKQVMTAGYEAAYEVARDQLRAGVDVIVECVNALTVTRNAWRHVASSQKARIIEVEFVCSNQQEHQRRVQERESTIVGLKLPTWAQVQGRKYDPWGEDHLIIDTAIVTPIDAEITLILEYDRVTG